MASNVLRFPKAREPTVRAAEGFPPPFPSIHFHRPRRQGAQRRCGKRVLADVIAGTCHEARLCVETGMARHTDNALTGARPLIRSC
jgi:hypothetical protein